jgi:hypothetical protein
LGYLSHAMIVFEFYKYLGSVIVSSIYIKDTSNKAIAQIL